jgi:hypothetical protein
MVVLSGHLTADSHPPNTHPWSMLMVLFRHVGPGFGV